MLNEDVVNVCNTILNLDIMQPMYIPKCLLHQRVPFWTENGLILPIIYYTVYCYNNAFNKKKCIFTYFLLAT